MTALARRRGSAALLLTLALASVSSCSSGGSAGSSSRVSATPITTALGYHAVANGAVLKLQGTPSKTFPTLNDRHGVMVVNLWAQWCGPCRAEAPVLKTAASRLRSDGVQFVGIDTEDDPSRADGFAKAHGWTWPQFYDMNALTLHAAGFVGLPDTVLLSASDRIEGYFIGPVTNLKTLMTTVSALAH